MESIHIKELFFSYSFYLLLLRFLRMCILSCNREMNLTGGEFVRCCMYMSPKLVFSPQFSDTDVHSVKVIGECGKKYDTDSGWTISS